MIAVNSLHANYGRSLSRQFPTRGAHFLNEDIGAFDAPFFSVTAQEVSTAK